MYAHVVNEKVLVVAALAVRRVSGDCKFMTSRDGNLQKCIINLAAISMRTMNKLTSMPSFISPVRISGPFYKSQSINQ